MRRHLVLTVIVGMMIVFAPKVRAQRQVDRLSPQEMAESRNPKFKKLIKQAYKGNAKAQYQVAMLYDKGDKFLPKDQGAAIAWLEEAAMNGNRDAKKLLHRH